MSYKVYMIRPKSSHEKGHIYYGSTKKDNRFHDHMIDYDRWFIGENTHYTSSFKLFMMYGFDNCELIILKEDINTKNEALEIEKEYISSNDCINIHHNKKDMTKQTTKRIIKDELTPAQIRYRNDNDFKEKQRKLSREHKNKYPELYEKYNCECGGCPMLKNIKVHNSSKSHKYFLEFGTKQPLL